jgi:uncharacterized integral membrane protein
LFVKDLSSGLCGEILSNKCERDCSVGSSKTRAMLEGVSKEAKSVGWSVLVLSHIVMLLFVFLFAIQQTHSRQSAWFSSFLMWVIYEVCVASTCGVFVIHLLIPLYVYGDIAKIKEKVLRDLLTFREEYMSANRDEEEGRDSAEGKFKFNAAKYLYTSWRVASLCRGIPESGLILHFSTPWPKHKFGETDEVATEYDQDVVFNTLVQIAFYFLGSLFRIHTLVQDILIQTVCNLGFGFLGVWIIELFAIHPALPVAVVVMMVVLLGSLLRMTSGTSEMRLRLNSVTPIQTLPTPPPELGSDKSPPKNRIIPPTFVNATPFVYSSHGGDSDAEKEDKFLDNENRNNSKSEESEEIEIIPRIEVRGGVKTNSFYRPSFVREFSMALENE